MKTLDDRLQDPDFAYCWRRELIRERIYEIGDIAQTLEMAVRPFPTKELIDCLLKLRRIRNQCQDEWEAGAFDASDDLCGIAEANLIELRGAREVAKHSRRAIFRSHYSNGDGVVSVTVGEVHHDI